MARLPVAPRSRSSFPTAMRAVAIAAVLSAACGPAGGGNSGTAGSGGTSSGVAGSGAGGTSAAGSGGSSSGVAGTMGSGGSGAGGVSGSGGAIGRGGSSGTTGAGGSSGGTTGTGGSGAAGRGGAGGSAAGTGGSGTGTGGSSSGPVYNPSFKEFYGDDCTVATPKDVSISGQLPNLFTNIDGTTMAKKSDWKCRRAELKAIVEKYIHGPKPGRPTTVTGSVSSTAIKVHVDNNGKSIDFSVSVSIPAGKTGPVPIIIGLGGSSLDPSIVSAEGVATGNYDHQAMSSETSRTGLFSTIYGTSTGASAQVGWAWGISRVIDVLVDEKAAGRN